MNTGLDQALQIMDKSGEALWTADLAEDGDPRDPEAHKYKSAVPPWHGLSADGDVTGQLVYVNYGSHEDYTELIAQGTNLTGKIVIARYGRIFRGLKVISSLSRNIPNLTSYRSKVLKNWARWVSSFTQIRAMMVMSPSQTIILPILLALHVIHHLFSVEACSICQFIQEIRLRQAIQHMRMRIALKDSTFPRSLVCLFHGRMRRDFSRRFPAFMPQLRMERKL